MTAEIGAENMLTNCANAQTGERLLIAYEPAEYGYYNADAVACVQAAASNLGLEVELLNVGFSPRNPHLTPELMASLERADIVLFLARLGDQLRFSDMPPGKRILVSFALDAAAFASGFGLADHNAMVSVKNKVNRAIADADHVQVTCPLGTDFSGKPELSLGPESDTSILRFPMSVFTPVPAHSFSGKVALCGFLTGTGSRYYDNYTREFDGLVKVVFESGHLVVISLICRSKANVSS